MHVCARAMDAKCIKVTKTVHAVIMGRPTALKLNIINNKYVKNTYMKDILKSITILM